ncbi:pilus assembly protein PilM [Paenibacillus sp. SN-8-1]|uniref:pilus assembly protein PilM n=1 Tax=Paenibacillus sp. SN-8-1 TaxID=3435409 RepID=UPI003D9A6B02
MMSGNKHIGLTVDPGGIRYVIVAKKNIWEVERCGHFPFPKGVVNGEGFHATDDLHEQLKFWVKQEKLQGSTATISIPTSHMIIRKLSVETGNPKEITQLVGLEVETTLHLPFTDPVYDFIPVESTDSSTEVLVYASRPGWVVECNELLNDIGIKVKHAEVSSTALARTIQNVQDIPFQDTLLLYFGKEGTEVYLFHNNHPVFMRVINEYQHEELKEQGLTPEIISDINAEISRLLNFYQYSIQNGGSRITEVIVSGEVQGREQFVSLLQLEQPDIQVNVFDFEATDYIIPFGLAVRENKDKYINLLRQTKFSYRRIPTYLLMVGIAWIIGLSIILTLILVNKSAISENQATIKELEIQSSKLEQELVKLENGSNSVTDPNKVLEYIKENKQYSYKVWDELQLLLPEGSSIKQVDYSKPGTLAVSIQTADMKGISDYLVSLRAASFVNDVRLQNFTNNSGLDWSANYSIQWKSSPRDEAAQQEGGR